MTEMEYADKVILALRTKYLLERAKNQTIGEEICIGLSKKLLQRTVLFEGKYSMLLPDNFVDMDDLKKKVRYRSQNRPQIIKTNEEEKDVSITFNLLPMECALGEDCLQKLKNIQANMKRIWKQNVFYDIGELPAIPIAWMDFRAYCLAGSLYSLIFLLELENEIVLGNFHCSFMRYDIWKPVVLKLLGTIQINYECNQVEKE